MEGNHEPIISRDVFMRVQDELVRRRNIKPSSNGKRRNFSSNHCFSGIVVCGECDEMFRRIHWNNHGCRSIVWRCISRLEATGLICHARTVNELLLEEIVLKAINTMLGQKTTYLQQLQQNIVTVLQSATTQNTEIDKLVFS